MMKKNVIIEAFSQKQFRYMNILPYRTQLKEFLSLSLDRCMKAVDARSGSIFLLDDNRKELVLEISRNIRRLNLEGTRTALGERIVGRVASKRKPLLVENIDREPFLSYLPRYNHYGSKSFLSVPLEFSGNLIGVVNVTDKSTGSAFDDKDLRIILNICKYLGLAFYSLESYLNKQKKMTEEISNELDRLKKSLGRSKKFSSLGKIVGGLVHEINNPLDGVIRYVNLTLGYLEEDGPAKEYLQEAKAGLVRIARIVRSLLDFSWSLSPQDGTIDINRTIEESLFAFNRLILTNNIEVKKFFNPELEQVPDFRLKLVFNNIIKNACEAMNDGGILTIYTGNNEDGVQIIFQDTGEGIREDLQEKIFDPFFTTKKMGEGSGLGLAISHEIIQRYKGTIHLKSKPGEGTAFIIHIPNNNR